MEEKLHKLKWLVIDGLPYELLKKYLDPERTPCLTEMMSRGKITPLETLHPNCQTPPSLFSIWSGHPPSSHRILGYDTPDGKDPGGFRNGFTGWPENIDMIWDRYARAGYRVRLNHIPFVNELKLGQALVARGNIYGHHLYPSQTVSIDDELTIPPLGLTIRFWLLNPEQTKITLQSSCEIKEEVIANGSFIDIQIDSHPEPLVITLLITNNTKEYICCLLGKNLYRRSGLSPDHTGTAPGADFCHATLVSQYRNGQLGPKLLKGGTGDAEQILFQSLHRVHSSFSGELVQSFSRQDADLTVGYYPVVDLALHEILGLEAEVAKHVIVKALFHQLMIWVESLVAGLQSQLQKDDILVINSDHGMQPIHHTCYINKFFADCDWLIFDHDGRIEWENTQVVYHPAENGTLMLHPSCNAEQIRQKTIGFFDELGFIGSDVVRLDFVVPQYDFMNQYFLLPPDGIRVKACASDQYASYSPKSGDHCGYSQHPWLKGVLMTHQLHKPQTKLNVYEILNFIEEY